MTLSQVDDSPVDFLPEHALSRVDDAAADTIPLNTLGGDGDALIDFIPQGSLSAVDESVITYIPIRNFGAPTGAFTLLAPDQFHGAPTGAYVANFSPTRGYSGHTGEHVTVAAPPRTMSGTTGASATLTRPERYSTPTGDHTGALRPTRGFGGGTSGVTEGLLPVFLTATVLGAGEIRLDWIDQGPDEIGYRIERSLAGQNDWSILDILAADTATFLDRFAVPLVVYDYRVFGFDAFKDSPSSNIATAVTPLPPDLPAGPPPEAPEDPIRTRIEPEQIEFKSPGIYGLEKGPDGDVSGFKF